MNFIEKLLKIPHLDLGFTFNDVALREDLKTAMELCPFQPYETKYADANKNFYQESWQGLSLVGVSDDCTVGMTENSGMVEPEEYTVTELGRRCQDMLDAVDFVVASHLTTRVRIMKIPAGRTLGWHSHTKDHFQAPALLTVQLPIVMPDGFEYAVTTKDNIKSRIPPAVHDESKVHRARYDVGCAYIFNSFEYHNVFNPTDEDRYTLMFYGNVFEDRWFRDSVEAAVEEYDGPLI